MPTRSRSSRTIELSVPPDAQWTLHHVLRHRIERGGPTEKPLSDSPPRTSRSEPGPPASPSSNRPESAPRGVVSAFETLDSGETHFTRSELEVMQDVLARYQRAIDWELERAAIERLLHRVSMALEAGTES